MIVCIAEKPSVAREIASVLGANTKHDGYYEDGTPINPVVVGIREVS